MRILAIVLFAGSFFGARNLPAQRILYNQDLDTKGKAADTAAKALTASGVTDKELQNLAVLEKVQIDRILSAATVTMRREVEALSTWGDAAQLVERIKKNIALVDLASLDAKDLKQQQDDVNEQVNILKASLDELKKVSKQKPPSLDPVINLLGDVKDLSDFVGKDAKGVSASIQKVIDGLKEVNALIDTVHTIWSSARAVSVDPRSLAPSIEETELAVLAVEVQYLKELTLLRARQQLDYAEVLSILTQLQKEIKDANLPLGNQIRGDLATVAAQMSPSANYDQLRRQMRARVHILYLAASASAQNMIAADVEVVRETLAWRRYQIRTTAVYNGTYEIAIQAASGRLATYYGAGLKPSQIAQLLHDLAAAVSLPKIAF